MNKLKEYFLLLIVFLIPWQARWLPNNFVYTDIYNEYTLPSLFVIDIPFVVAILIFFPWSNFRKINYKLVLLVLSWLTLNAIFATQPFFVIWKAVFIFVLFGFIYVLQKNVDFQKISIILILAGVIQAIIGLIQFFLQHIPASTVLGIAEQSASILGSSVIETANGRWLRAYGTFPHPNLLGGFLAIILLLIIDSYQNIYRDFKTLWQENKKEQFTKEDKKFLENTGLKISAFLLSFLVIFSGLLVSFSRSAWLAFAIGFVVYAILEYRKKNNIVPMVKLFVAGFLITLSFFILYTDLFSTRFTNETRLEKNSVEERVSGYESYTNIFANNWLTGTGMGNYVIELANRNHGQPAYTHQPIHNTFLLAIAEVGIFGVILLGYLLRRKKIIWTSLSVGLLIAMGVIGLFDHYLWSVHSGLLFSIFLLINTDFDKRF